MLAPRAALAITGVICQTWARPHHDDRVSSGARESTGVRRAINGAYQLYWGSGVCDDVPAMAWFLVTACVPLSLGIVAVASIVLGDAERANAVARKLAEVLPPGARGQVLELVLRTRRDSPWLLALSIGSMIWACSGATGVIERVESRLLALPRRPPVKLKLRHLMLAASMALMIALLAIAAVEATDLRNHLGIHVPGWVVSLGTVPLIALICALLYRYATVRRLDWTPSVRGGLPAAVMVVATPLLAGYYTRAVAGRTPVQVFLVLAGLLFTCYLIAVGLLIGAGLACTFQRGTDRANPPAAHSGG
jgi:uncharacterized BrkB/YihY/UPF0761 family membrane protein